MKILTRVLQGVAIILFVLIFGVMTAALIGSNTPAEREKRETLKQAAIDALKSSYDQLEIGMSYEECVKIVGAEGELFSESETEYFGKTKIYLWKPKDKQFTGIEAYFKDGNLLAKTWLDN